MVQNAAKIGHWGANRGLLNVENLIWMGDLNYRLTMPDSEVPTPYCNHALQPIAGASQLNV